MAKAKKKESLSVEEKLEQALLPVDEQPYEVPKNWCWTKWGTIGDFIAGNGFKNEYQGFSEYEIPFYKVGSLKYADDKGYLYDESNTITEEMRAKLKATLIPINSIIFAKIGEAIRLNRRCLNNKACCIDNNTMAFITHGCNFRYVYYWTLGQEFYDLANATTVPAIRKSDLEEVKIPIAPLAEQQRIVEQIENLFAKLDEAKEKVQAVIDSYEIRRTAILQKVFKEAMEKSAELKECSLSEIADVISGYAFSSSSFMDSNGIPCVKITNVGVKRFLDEDFQYLPEEFIDTYDRFVVRENDILISLTRSYINAGLKVCVYNRNEPALLNQRVALICNCNREYIYYYLQTDEVLQYVKEKSKTTNQPNLSIKDLNAMMVPCLSNDDEMNVVKQIKKLLENEERFMDSIINVSEKIDLMKKSILAKAFRGELGTSNPEEESATELLKLILSRE